MSKNKELVLADTVSPAKKYDALLLERVGPGLTEDKVILVFRVLDQLIPELGIYSQVCKKIRDTIYDAVYSDQYTGSQGDESGSDTSRFIQRIPYFTLARRVYDERDEKAEQLQDHLDTVQRKLFDKQCEYEESLDKIADLQQEIDHLSDTIEDLQTQVKDRTSDIHSLESTLSQERGEREREEYHLNCDIRELKDDLAESQGEVAYLRQYKTGYDELEAAFHTQSALEDPLPRKKKKPVIATKRAHFVSSIESALKLEENILTVQNATIEEFDKYLEQHKDELTRKTEDMVEDDYYDQDQLIEQVDTQLLLMEDRFQRSMNETSTELELLRQHRTMLQEQLHVLEENKPQVKTKRKPHKSSNVLEGRMMNGESRPQTQESGFTALSGLSGFSAGLDDGDDDDPAADPFIAQERVFSKYAAMLYSSDNNGKTFMEFKEAKFCPSCGEKTVLCPHKILKQEHVFLIPNNSTHLKISRPKVRISQDMMETVGQPGMSDIAMDTLTNFTPDSKPFKHMHSRLSVSAAMSPMMAKSPAEESSVTSADTAGFGAESHLVHSIQRLWEDYKERTSLERAVPRALSQVRTLSLIEQLSAFTLCEDETTPEDDHYESVLNSLYNFLSKRYMKPDIMYMVAHDFLSALVDYSGCNKIIQLFTHVLIGNYDGAVFRYFLLMCDFIDLVEWKQVDDFRNFASAIYPFLNEDDLETLHMGYTSFSENRISKQLVAEYLVYIILKYREPRFLEMETKLLNHPGQDSSQMTEQEFIEAVEAVLAVPNDQLRKRLYMEAFDSIRQTSPEAISVPVLRLAQQTSYLGLLQIAPVVKDTVVEKVCGVQERPSSTKTGISQHSAAAPVAEAHFLSMSKSKTLASNIAKRVKIREARMMADMEEE